MDYLTVCEFPKSLFLSDQKSLWLLMVKGYWEKRFKKELVEEGDKLKKEVAEAVRRKLDGNAKEEPES